MESSGRWSGWPGCRDRTAPGQAATGQLRLLRESTDDRRAGSSSRASVSRAAAGSGLQLRSGAGLLLRCGWRLCCGRLRWNRRCAPLRNERERAKNERKCEGQACDRQRHCKGLVRRIPVASFRESTGAVHLHFDVNRLIGSESTASNALRLRATCSQCGARGG